MEHLHYIKKKLEELKATIQTSPFDENDVRRDFFGLIWDVLDNYYKGFTFFALTKFIADGDVIFKKTTEDLSDHIKHLTSIASHHLPFASYRNNLHRSIVLDSWSTFEFCITTISRSVLDELTIKELLFEEYTQTINTLKNIDLEKEADARLQKRLIKKDLAHVSINRKCDKLFSSIKKIYKRNLEEDREFLLFLGRYRNCMHSNYFYFGNDVEYKFKDVEFHFKNGYPIGNVKEYGIDLHFDIILNLADIFAEIVNKIKYDETIPYPDLQSP